MFGLNALSRVQRLILGIVVLLIVDLIWVASAELSNYIFRDTNYRKPYFTTYFKTTMFVIYLTGFILWKPWREQCRRGPKKVVEDHIESPPATDTNAMLGDPVYVPVKAGDKNSGTESDDASSMSSSKSVRFSDLSEVRQLSDTYAEEHLMARLSYQASVRAEEARLRSLCKLTIRQVVKLAAIFCVLWFFGQYCYQQALNDSQPAVVNVLSSTSSLFTLVCAAVYPSSGTDKFTLSKLVAVLISFGGVVLVSISDLKQENGVPAGALWALGGAIFYAVYLVSLRRRVDHEDKLDIPMFFGFVGLFCAVLMWPGFFIVHYSKAEPFEWPDKEQWLLIAVNGLVGTVFSEFLWLWACFLTSSLIATLALSLVIPLTIMADVVMKGESYSWLFYLGSVPVFVAFFSVSFLTHYENWDPVLLGVKKFLHLICRLRLKPRVRDLDREQTESLIHESAQ